MRKIALNEWPLSGTQIGTPNVRVWANADRPLRINADQQRERRDLVDCGLSAFEAAVGSSRRWGTST